MNSLKTTHFPRYMLLGIVGLAALFGLFKSLALLPLAEAVTIHFTETLIIIAMAALYLKEKVGMHGWIAVLVGFCGVFVMMNPTAEVINLGIFFALLFAAGDAFYMINARVLTRTDPSSTVVFYFVAIVSLLAGALLPFNWQTPNLEDFAILVALGIGSGLGQMCITQAYKHAPASVVTPMIYTCLLWSIFYGYIFWGEVPDAKLILGGSLIVGSGLFVILKERKQVI